MSTDDRDLTFTAADFRRVRDMVYRHAGIALSEAKSDMAYARLARRVRAMGEKRFSVYLDVLSADPAHPEWQSFVNALTTNLTAFFREPHHFEMLAKHFGHHAGAGALYRVWSAAASTGEEPYSVAMTLAEAPLPRPCPIEVVATDIDTNVLKTAAAGVYPEERIALLSKTQLKAHFLRGKGKQEGFVRVKPGLRAAIQFGQLNLAADRWPDIGLFDAVFCRNVMIYFDNQTQRAILQRLADHMQPHALLFLGHSENIQLITDAFVPCGRTAYRKAGRGS
ncbi:MAG: chemotaxis protein CheR [Paludibacterium sp.]|uniref:CheR family methyltransferase n=1 Tax=Paludibacterium sp. TaxID=1917523 RepID=UPI0025DE137F|nr:CheR family methyltransferase [Paludibacterium sp.]MBV8047511.1 chemotaxis protein CheR [Paludibacterium sp.]MBV8648369.1 chemotaxis protein CheR [Paludibacterium sp.]